jgi:allantoin racemase
MKILVLNPNTSKIVTEKIANKIRQVARPDVHVDIKQIEHGPESLESYYDEALATPYSIQAVVKANDDGYDAIILAAFCDPGLEALKEISKVPVYGIEETAFSVALLLGHKFSILTEKQHKISVKNQHVRKYGLQDRYASVRALAMGVVEIAENPEKVKEVGIQLARKMIEDDGAEVIIMGCASMAGYSEDLQKELGIPVIDPIAVTYKVVEGLTELGMQHSKIGLYAVPAKQKMN